MNSYRQFISIDSLLISLLHAVTGTQHLPLIKRIVWISQILVLSACKSSNLHSALSQIPSSKFLFLLPLLP